MGRRAVLAGLAAAVPVLAASPALGFAPRAPLRRVPIGGGVSIVPRAEWGGDLPPTGALEAEAPGDVRFLLVHHTVSANGYAADAVPGLLRSIYRFHTGDKGWADVAYNFFVDAHGQVWEGRTGSIDSPVKGDATGGSQGHALLCCFVGDHQTVAPTPAAQQAMVALLAWLASRYGIDPSPGATTTFTSRGSQKWPAGSQVTTPTITGHRTMSNTVCPGEAAWVLVRDELPSRVAATAGAPSTSAAPTTSEAPASSTTEAPTTAAPAIDDAAIDEPSTTAPTTAAPTDGAGADDVAAGTAGDDGSGGVDGLAVGLGTAAVAAGVTGAALVWRGRRLGEDQP